jgi:hypothetical protein
LWNSFVGSSIPFFCLFLLSLSLLMTTHYSSTQAILGVLIFLLFFFAGSSFPLYIIGSIFLCVISNLLLYRGKYIKMAKDHLHFFFRMPAGPINFNEVGLNLPLLFALLFSILFCFNLLTHILVLPNLDPFTQFCMLQLLGTVSIYVLDVWGRTSNYLTFALAPSCILTAILIDKWLNEPFGILLFTSTILISFFLSLRTAKIARNTVIHINKPLLLLFEWIRKQNDARIICFPAEYCRPLAYYTGKKVLYASGWKGVVWNKDFLNPMYEEVKKGNIIMLEKAIHSFAITHIFIDTTKFDSTFLNKIPNRLLRKENEYCLFSTVN